MTSDDQHDDPAQARMSSALHRLDGLDQRPLGDHAGLYEGVHEELQAVLAEIDGG